MKRTIIKIDEELCNGCGICIEGCHEGALQLIDDKARMISDLYCDGLGACIPECPVGAITLEEREAEPYDEVKVMERISPKGEATVLAHLNHLIDHDQTEFVNQGIQYIKDNNLDIDLSKLKKKHMNKMEELAGVTEETSLASHGKAGEHGAEAGASAGASAAAGHGAGAGHGKSVGNGGHGDHGEHGNHGGHGGHGKPGGHGDHGGHGKPDGHGDHGGHGKPGGHGGHGKPGGHGDHGGHGHGGGCPGSRMMNFAPPAAAASTAASAASPASASTSASAATVADQPSELRQWPVQLHLVNPQAPYFQQADVLLAADCVAFSMGNFHSKYLKGKGLAIACPKLDSGKDVYIDKLAAMIDHAGINTLTVMIMEVPCCSGLLQMAKMATEKASRKVPVKAMVVGLDGQIRKEEWI